MSALGSSSIEPPSIIGTERSMGLVNTCECASAESIAKS